jgi:methylmalonyl-CoA mutase cobalamin-binding subunit
MSEVGEVPISIIPTGLPANRELEPRASTHLIISTDISSGEYARGIKAAPLERDDGLALLIVRNAARAQQLNPLLVMSSFANVSGERAYQSLQRLERFWGEAKPPIVKGTIEAQHASTEAVERAIDILKSSPVSVSLVALGAFTDVAEIVRMAKEQGLSDKISEIILAAPSEDIEGNSQSFNTKADPEALKYLKQSEVTLVYGWDGTLQHAVSREIVQILENSADPLDKYVAEGLEIRNAHLARASNLSKRIGRNLPGVLPEHEKRGGRMCIQDMIIPVYLASPELFRKTKTQYGYKVEIADHQGVDEKVQELVKSL